MKYKKSGIAILIVIVFLCSCSIFKNDLQPSSTGEPFIGASQSKTDNPAGLTITATPFQPIIEPEAKKIYLSPDVPETWIEDLQGINTTPDPSDAALTLAIKTADIEATVYGSFERIYAVGAPFPTVTDGFTTADLQAVWLGNPSLTTGEFSRFFVTETTKNVISKLWGEPASQAVYILPKEDLVTELWKVTNAWAIVPFEEIEPRLKIMRVDGISPLDRPMNTADYALKVTYTMTGNKTVGDRFKNEIAIINSTIPATNRDESKMTVVVMSGTTALARVTLKKIELNGYDYPVELIKDWFLSADLRHVSNEVSFNEACHYTDAFTMQFCSKPDQIKVLENLGINVVESTGNHLNDYGSEYFEKTLQMYQDRGWLNFGGGLNAESAKLPATTEVNGNRIAFIGCNPVGFETAWATDTRAGAAKCDHDWFNQKISELKSQGYIVIATFQETEIDLPMYDEKYRTPFKDAARAGADIVQGSQAHVPMGFEFVGNTLIHYGLGNFLFDQMEPVNIREFIDRHILYDGKYIGTEILTATLTDWSRPMPMNDMERQSFLDELFTDSKLR